MTTTEINVIAWTTKDVANWLQREGFNSFVIRWICDENEINGKCLLALNETDFNSEPLMRLSLKDRKLLLISIKLLQRDNQSSLMQLGLIDTPTVNLYSHHHHYLKESDYCDSERLSPPASEDGGRSQRLPPEIWKAFLSFCYVIGVTWITAIVMVIVHDRVPDMKKYPPLPDIFLDNVPHIPWAFDMCEVTGTVMMFIWIIVLVFHKHRFILMRRFFALSGTVFLLRCVTMLITSLSVPGAHLQCQPRIYSLQDENASFYDDLKFKLAQAYIIWRGAGMSIQGVRTCGDYMFSGHTVALTMLNFFITEYTPRHFYFLHTLTWMMNMFGIFFILAAHEHYSIDVFVAFYISSRLFLYYHTLSNNQALMQRDSNRTRVWFPLFSYFEASVDGIVPNEYNTPTEIIVTLKDFLMAKFSEVRSYHMQLTRQHMMQRPQSQQQQQQCNNNAEDKVDVLNNYDGSDIKEISADGGVKMKVC